MSSKKYEFEGNGPLEVKEDLNETLENLKAERSILSERYENASKKEILYAAFIAIIGISAVVTSFAGFASLPFLFLFPEYWRYSLFTLTFGIVLYILFSPLAENLELLQIKNRIESIDYKIEILEFRLELND